MKNKIILMLTILMLQCATHAFAAEDSLTRGLTGYWNFDEQDRGNTALDSSPSKKDGSLTNGPKRSKFLPAAIQFKNKYSMEFDGVDDYINLGAPYSIVDNLTIAVWVYSRDTTKLVLPFMNGDSGLNGYGIIISNGGCLAGNLIDLLVGGVSCHGVDSVVRLEQNTWTHIVISREKGTWRLFINGLEKHSGVITPAAPTALAAIGGVDTGGILNGFMDDVRFYNRALTRKEIQFLATGYDDVSSQFEVDLGPQFSQGKAVVGKVFFDWNGNGEQDAVGPPKSVADLSGDAGKDFNGDGEQN